MHKKIFKITMLLFIIIVSASSIRASGGKEGQAPKGAVTTIRYSAKR
jgi:hypothetical protein